MAGEPAGSPHIRIVYFSDPSTFGPGDYVRSDRAAQDTHVELTVRTVPDAEPDQESDRIAYRQRIPLEAEAHRVVSVHYYCRGVLPGPGGDRPSPAELCLGPLAPESDGTGIQFNSERFRTAHAISAEVPDGGAYDFALVTQTAEKNEDTGDVTIQGDQRSSRSTGPNWPIRRFLLYDGRICRAVGRHRGRIPGGRRRTGSALLASMAFPGLCPGRSPAPCLGRPERQTRRPAGLISRLELVSSA